MAKVILQFDDMENGQVGFTVRCDPELPEDTTKERLTKAQSVAIHIVSLIDTMQRKSDEN